MILEKIRDLGGGFMAKILITGAAGFMGSHLFDYLREQGHYVVGMDNYSIGTYKYNGIDGVIDNIDLVTDYKKVEKAIKLFKPEIVYFLSAWAHEGLSQFMPNHITQNNYNAYLNVLIPSIKAGVKRIVLTSSMSVYGDQIPPFTEEMDRKPADVYAVAKTSMERTTEILSAVHGFEYVIIRPHNVYGPRQNMADPYRNVVAIFMNRALQGKPCYIYGDGEQKRSFSYIDDVTPYLAKAGFADISGEIINIGPLEEFTINQLQKEVAKNFEDQPDPIYVADRPLEVKHAWCSNEKAQRLLGYKTSVTFAEGIAKMAEWAKKEGSKTPKYLDELELESDNTPVTWKNKLI